LTANKQTIYLAKKPKDPNNLKVYILSKKIEDGKTVFVDEKTGKIYRDLKKFKSCSEEVIPKLEFYDEQMAVV
jgi:hypothetical protein